MTTTVHAHLVGKDMITLVQDGKVILPEPMTEERVMVLIRGLADAVHSSIQMGSEK